MTLSKTFSKSLKSYFYSSDKNSYNTPEPNLSINLFNYSLYSSFKLR
nr:MAG TPA: hypothetical protein [Caudoviricetes sp.]